MRPGYRWPNCLAARAAILITSAETDAALGGAGWPGRGADPRGRRVGVPGTYLWALGGTVAVPSSGKGDGMSFIGPGKL